MSSKADYLKKYLSGPKGSSGTKKKKKPEGGNTIIIDEDVDWRSRQPAKKSSLYGKGSAQRKNVLATADDAGSDDEAELQRAFQMKVQHSDGSGWASVEPNRDLSPPRRGRSSPASPRVKTEPMPDQSPPRRVKVEDSSDMRDSSPPRPVKTEPESSSEMRDLSPPRRGREAERGLSPPRRSSASASSNSMADLSPPRRGAAAEAKDRDLSPPRRGNNSKDRSPPRRQPAAAPATAASKNDLSPPRRGRGRSKSKSKSKDASPARGRARHDSPDQSPPRSRQRHDSPDASSNGRSSSNKGAASKGSKRSRSRSDSGSPPRKRTRHDSESPEPRDKKDAKSDSSSSSSSSVRAGTGLQNAAQFTARAKEDAERKQAALKALPADVSGVNSKTILRDRHGRKLSALEIMQKQSGGQYQNEDEKGMVWGKGLVQTQNAAEKAEDLAAERDDAFARSRNDSKLDELQRGRERWGDPMLEALKKKEKKRQELAATANASAVVGTPRPRPVFQGQSWTNRFALKSGYRWDGVDRSNGWENKMFKYNAEKGARNLEAHRWSVSDM